MTLFIDHQGAVHGVYNDTLSKLPLGPLHVERASNVEFCNKTQRWVAIDKLGNRIASGTCREAVIKQEVEIVTTTIQRELEQI